MLRIISFYPTLNRMYSIIYSVILFSLKMPLEEPVDRCSTYLSSSHPTRSDGDATESKVGWWGRPWTGRQSISGHNHSWYHCSRVTVFSSTY